MPGDGLIPLQTARLTLRAFRPDDRDDLVDLNADPAVREFLGMPRGQTPEEASAWIESMRAYPEGSERGFWAAEESGRFVGWFHLRDARDTGETELGYRFRRDAWGRGLATEGGRALIDLAGERVIARTLLLNVRSRHVMERLGMAVVREFVYDDRLPSVEYATMP